MASTALVPRRHRRAAVVGVGRRRGGGRGRRGGGRRGRRGGRLGRGGLGRRRVGGRRLGRGRLGRHRRRRVGLLALLVGARPQVRRAVLQVLLQLRVGVARQPGDLVLELLRRRRRRLAVVGVDRLLHLVELGGEAIRPRR